MRIGPEAHVHLRYFQGLFAIWHLLKFHMNLRIRFLHLCIKGCWDLDRDSVESRDHCGEYCHFHFVCECSVAKLCSALCNLMDCSLPGSSVDGISQERILEWVAVIQGLNPHLLHWQVDSLPLSHREAHVNNINSSNL